MSWAEAMLWSVVAICTTSVASVAIRAWAVGRHEAEIRSAQERLKNIVDADARMREIEKGRP